MADFTINHIAHDVAADLKPALDEYMRDPQSLARKRDLERALWENKVGILRLAEKYAVER